MEIANRVALITGGASGLGGATAERLVSQGAKVCIADVSVENGKAMAAKLGDAAVFAHCDVTVTDQVSAAVEQTVTELGGLDILVNCAGVGMAMRTVGRTGMHDLDVFKWVININLIGTFDFIRHAAAKMVENEPDEDGGRGVIINTSSVAAFDGQIGQAAYSASKAGVVGMTLTIARDLSSRGVRVCTICPGIFDTPLLAALPEKVRENLAASMPFPKRLGKPEEFALLAEQIVRNPFLNGETIRLDAAIRMAPK